MSLQTGSIKMNAASRATMLVSCTVQRILFERQLNNKLRDIRIGRDGERPNDICLMCLTCQPLARSHYVPDCVLQAIGLNEATASLSSAVLIEPGPHDEVRESSHAYYWGMPLLCSSCEGFFSSKYEGEAKKIFAIPDPTEGTPYGVSWEYVDKKTKKTVTVGNVSVDSDYLLGLMMSIMWRTVLAAWFDIESEPVLVDWLFYARMEFMKQKHAGTEAAQIFEFYTEQHAASAAHIHLFFDDLMADNLNLPFALGELEFRCRNIGYNFSLLSVGVDPNYRYSYGIQVGRVYLTLCFTSEMDPTRPLNCCTGLPLRNKLLMGQGDVNLSDFVKVPFSLFLYHFTKRYVTYKTVLERLRTAADETELTVAVHEWLASLGELETYSEWIDSADSQFYLAPERNFHNVRLDHEAKMATIQSTQFRMEERTPEQQAAVIRIVNERYIPRTNWEATFLRSVGIYIVATYLQDRRTEIRARRVEV